MAINLIKVGIKRKFDFILSFHTNKLIDDEKFQKFSKKKEKLNLEDL